MTDNTNKQNQGTDGTHAKSQVMNLPNILTLSRVIMIPIFVLFYYLPFTGHYFVALAIFGVASFTDYLDGMIARKRNLVTNFGKFMDPIADKVLVLTAFIVFITVPTVFTQNLGNWAIIVAGCGVSIIVAREIIVGGFRLVAADCGHVIAADIYGKIKTVTQDFAIVFIMVGLSFGEVTPDIEFLTLWMNYIGLAFFAASVVLTVMSGANYIVKNVDVLKK